MQKQDLQSQVTGHLSASEGKVLVAMKMAMARSNFLYKALLSYQVRGVFFEDTELCHKPWQICIKH
jgi:hypothetical protein